VVCLKLVGVTRHATVSTPELVPSGRCASLPGQATGDLTHRVRVLGSVAKIVVSSERDRKPLSARARETYVLYDPEHPEQCDIDRDRLTREFGTVRDMGNDRQRIMIPQAVSRPGQAQAAITSDGRAPAPEPARQPDDLAAALAQLGGLHADGTLTDLEFAEAKGRLLNSS
jgi:hypothetical protein